MPSRALNKRFSSVTATRDTPSCKRSAPFECVRTLEREGCFRRKGSFTSRRGFPMNPIRKPSEPPLASNFTPHVERDRSETQTCLELDHASSQSAAGLAKVRIVDGHVARVTSERDQVQLVEKVEEIGAQVQLGRFAPEKGHRRGFDKTHVKRLVARAAERIAVNERRDFRADIEIWRSCNRAHLWVTIVTGDDVREVAIDLPEAISAEVASSVAEVGRWERGAEGASSGDRGAIVGLNRRPRKTSVVLEGSIQLPAAEGFPDEIMAVP